MKFKYLLRKAVNWERINCDVRDRWPVPEFDGNRQPHFLFIVTPPHSGSTVIAEVLSASPRVGKLQRWGEGQWLVPGLCEKDRWNPKKEVNYQSVKAVWLNAFQKDQRSDPACDVVVEKSPPNMMRMGQLTSIFEKYSLIAMNRNPYAKCASTLYRNHDVRGMTSGERVDIVSRLAVNWLELSEKLQELIDATKMPMITYEGFCASPRSAIEKLRLPSGVLNGIDTRVQVKVKDYERQEIRSQNERQLAWLTDEELAAISDVLRRKRDVLEVFGYELMC